MIPKMSLPLHLDIVGYPSSHVRLGEGLLNRIMNNWWWGPFQGGQSLGVYPGWLDALPSTATEAISLSSIV